MLAGAGTSTDTAPPAAPPPTAAEGAPPKPADPKPSEQKYPELVAVIDTSAGIIKVRLAPNEVPKLVAHFANLANRHFYDGLKFHSVARGVQIHSGDPTGTGEGGCGYSVPRSFHKDLLYDKPGVLGLWTARQPPSSQFFITLAPNPRKHDLNQPGIGHVFEGLDVASRIKEGDVVKTIRIEGDASKLLADLAVDVAKWNGILDREAAKKPVEPTKPAKET